MVLPPLPDSQLLKDVCQEVAQREGFQPAAIEKDFYLTRLIWAVAQEQQKTLLLKGGHSAQQGRSGTQTYVRRRRLRCAFPASAQARKRSPDEQDPRSTPRD